MLASRRTPLILLAVVCAFGTGARAWDLGIPKYSAPGQGYVFDERYYVSAARVIAGIHTPAGDTYANASPSGTDPNGEHPQLGKMIIAASIELFGDNAIGWRITPVVFGLAALLLLYWLVRSAGGSQWLALGTTAIASVDNLWLVHSRIAVLDIYAVPFMLAAAAFYLRRRPVIAGVLIGIGSCLKEFAVYTLFVLLLLEAMRGVGWLWERHVARRESATLAVAGAGAGGAGAEGAGTAAAEGAAAEGAAAEGAGAGAEAAPSPAGPPASPQPETPQPATPQPAIPQPAAPQPTATPRATSERSSAGSAGRSPCASSPASPTSRSSRSSTRRSRHTAAGTLSIATSRRSATTCCSGRRRATTSRSSTGTRRSLRDVGHPRGIASAPTDWWVDRKVIPYYEVQTTVRVNGVVKSQQTVIFFRGEISRGAAVHELAGARGQPVVGDPTTRRPVVPGDRVGDRDLAADRSCST